MKIITVLLFITGIIGIQNTKAQTTVSDSARIIRTAKRNARNFKLSKELRKKFKDDNFPSSSDYFKPTIANASDQALLNDSLYVQNFRDAAFYNTVNGRTPPGLHDMLASHLPGRQGTEPKYTGGVQQIAKNDARHFKLKRDILKKFRAEHLPNTSDYFKPTAYYTSDAAMLNDSAYVKAFREAAFYKAIAQKDHSGGKGYIIAGSITLGVALIVTTIILITRIVVLNFH
jgi:hypothetical protein